MSSVLRFAATGLLLTVLAAAKASFALEVDLSASRDRVSVGEQFTVSVEVREGGVGSLPEPELPHVEHVRQVSSYRSQNFSYVNGRMSASLVVQYVMVADEEGEFTIGPAIVKGKESAQSKTVRVKVEPAGSAATTRRLGDETPAEREEDVGRDLIVVGKVDDESPYVNEQITYTFTFLRRVRILEGSRYVAPTTTGFWTEELDTTEPTEVIVEGRRYIAERVRTALFPTGPGEYTIGPATLHATIEDRNRAFRRHDPFDLFGRDPFELLRGGGREVVLQSDATVVRVKPLPSAGKPVDFTGAVGRFDLTAKVDRNAVKAGEPVTLTVTLSGEGNVKVIPAPDLSILEDFKIYQSQSNESSKAQGGKIVGTKTWEFVLVPTVGGDVEIPPVRVTLFDPGLESYVTKATSAIPLSVEATDLDDALARGEDLTVAKERVRLRQRDIRYAKPFPGRLAPAKSSPFASPGFLLAHALPALAMAGSVFMRRHREKLANDVSYARARVAAKTATKRLMESQRVLAAGKLEDFFGSLSRALRGYVADRLDLAAANLDDAAVRSGLAAGGLGAEQIEELFRMLGVCDSARFSPIGADPRRAAKLFGGAKDWITQVEK